MEPNPIAFGDIDGVCAVEAKMFEWRGINIDDDDLFNGLGH